MAVVSVRLKTADEWRVTDRMPCTIRLLTVPKSTAGFHDFEQFERLVETAKTVDQNTELIVLLGGERGS